MKRTRSAYDTFKIKEKTSYGVFRDSIAHYGIAWILLSIYGGRACPFVTGVELEPTIIALGAMLGVLYLLRSGVFMLFRKRLTMTAPAYYFLFEFLFFTLWAVAGVIWGVNYYAFHAEGIIKITFGSMVPGLFFTMEMLISRERYLIYHEKKHDSEVMIKNIRFFSLRKKILIFAIVSIGLAGISIILVTYKNFIWTAENVLLIPQDVVIASVIKETLFVIGVFLGLVIKLTNSYSRIISLYFSLLVQVLDRLGEEKYDSRIPITSQDEFALLSQHINGITVELAEKQKIKGVFGKIVSPVVAEKLLSEDHIELGGFEQEMVVLFVDIRGFTTLTEQSEPQKIIELLNTYHTAMVEVIHNCDGVVDKFIGDGMLAVFGLQDQEHAVRNACQAALLMQQTCRDKISTAVRIGIGIHKGRAIAGLVGSPERLEFTVIGDTVNTASRLETATKETGFDILISEDAFHGLEQATEDWKDAGYLKLKGKEQLVRAYGYTVPLNPQAT